ncbi:hypothetical protein L3Q82_006992 [Scortum barcoo]|uniref:Uncharacterized protein n=1 Tax=Scortum barcoo TaxID=214431 RepID=A0ACB8WWN2_9TELE|nr:hypothetical protein L3Q82_006992 [Scortum barcoo]
MASLTSGVHHWVWGCHQQAPETFLASTTSNHACDSRTHGGREHGPLLDSMSPASLGICEKFFPEVGVEDLPDRGLGQTFPTDPHNTFGSARSVQLPPLPADPTHHQVVIRLTAQPLSLPECPRHTAGDQMKRQQSRSSTSGLGCPGATCTDGHPYAQHGVRYGQTEHRSPITEHRSRVQIGEAVPPDHAPPGITVACPRER